MYCVMYTKYTKGSMWFGTQLLFLCLLLSSWVLYSPFNIWTPDNMNLARIMCRSACSHMQQMSEDCLCASYGTHTHNIACAQMYTCRQACTHHTSANLHTHTHTHLQLKTKHCTGHVKKIQCVLCGSCTHPTEEWRKSALLQSVAQQMHPSLFCYLC